MTPDPTILAARREAGEAARLALTAAGSCLRGDVCGEGPCACAQEAADAALTTFLRARGMDGWLGGMIATHEVAADIDRAGQK